MAKPRIANRGLEENTMAILDSSGVKEARDILDDKLSFLEAVRAASLVSDSPYVPTWRMCDAVFKIFREDDSSMELVLGSYQLLTDIDQLYPRVYLSDWDAKAGTGNAIGKIVVVKEGWSPFTVGLEGMQVEGDGTCRNSQGLIDSHNFSLLLQEMVETAKRVNEKLSLKTLRRLLLVVYLVNVLIKDFLPRQTVYKETMDWALVKESLLNMLLASRRQNMKAFIKDCMSILNIRWVTDAGSSLHDKRCSENFSEGIHDECEVALTLAIAEIERRSHTAIEILMAAVMELDTIKKQADMQGFTSRADLARTPAVDIIVDALAYDEDLVSPFMEVFSEPRWKLEIVLQFLWKYCSKPSVVRTRKSTKSDDDETLSALFSYLLNTTNLKSVIRKVSIDVVQLLLAHAFQACLSLYSWNHKGANDETDMELDISLKQICEDVITIFQNMKTIEGDLDLTSFEKEALFTAVSLVSIKP